MSVGFSIFLIAVGAILRYAITADIENVDLDTVGLILMLAGFAGLAISAVYMLISTASRNREAELDRQEREQYRSDRDYYDRGGGAPPR